MVYLKLPFYKNCKLSKLKTSPHGISGFADSAKTRNLEPHHMAFLDLLILHKLEIQQNWNSTKLEFTTCMASLELPFLWSSILIKKNCLIHAQFYSFKDSTKKRKNNLKSLQFSDVRNSTKHTLFAYSVQDFKPIFRKLEWPLLYTHSHAACVSRQQVGGSRRHGS